MAKSLSPEMTLRRLRQARNQLLLSQEAVLDLSSISDTEAARLDLPENRAKRLSDALGRPDMPLEQSMAIFGAAERAIRSDRTARDEKRTKQAKSAADMNAHGPLPETVTSPAAEETSSSTDADDAEEDSPVRDLEQAIANAGLPSREIINVLVNSAKISAAKSRSGLMLESLLISAVAQFEVFVSRLITISLRFDPSALESSDKKYVYSDVYKFDSIDSFTRAAADAYVDSLMYDGMASWMKFLAKATRSDTAWVSDLLEEVVMRRNVHVHAAGRASTQYIDSLGKKAAAVEVNDQLPVTAAYLEDALDRMARVAIVLSQAASAAVCSTTKGKAALAEKKIDPDQDVVRSSFDLLAAGRYGAVAPLSDQLESYPMLAASRERLKANSFVAKKKRQGLEAVKSDIMAWDVSAAEDDLLLAKHCLLEEIDLAKQLFRQMSDAERISVTELATWPILAPLRTALESDTEPKNDPED